MKTAKIFIIFTFLIILVLQISAQDRKTQIVWRNLQEKYERFEDIRPVIKNLFNKPIYLADPYYSVKIMYFDEDSKDWITVRELICGTSTKPVPPNKIFAQKDFKLTLNRVFWELTREQYDGPKLIENYRKAGIDRFKLELTYGTKKSSPYSIVSVSPEFTVKISKD